MANDRLRKVITEARVKCGRPNHCPSIVHEVMQHTDEFDTETMDRLMAIGLNKEVREFLKLYNEEDTELKPEQLDMWPKAVRGIVKDINRARVFVPSRDGFVELLPAVITATEMREAGDYLVSHGEDSIRRGNLLIRLADLSTNAA